MLLVDTKAGCVIDDNELKSDFAARQPYGEWLDKYLVSLAQLPLPNQVVEAYDQKTRDALYRAFGYNYEKLKSGVIPMALNANEQISSLGIDLPLAMLADKHQPLFNYFKQLFAQVTNPPTDAIREKIVTDTTVYVGADGNLLEERPENCTVLELPSLILSDTDLMKIRNIKHPGFSVQTISLLYFKATPLDRALDRLFVSCDRAYRNGANILILTDRGVDENHVAIPSLLAVSTLEQHLVRTKKRTAISVILESGEPRDVHHFATLLGFGARAINPCLAHKLIGELVEKKLIGKDYDQAVLNGIVKIASKMGISTIQSYQSAQIFEAIGLGSNVVQKYFTNTISRVGGIELKDIAEDVDYRHSHAFDPLGLPMDETLDSMGIYRLRSNGSAEDHMHNPTVIISLQESTRNGDYKRFKEYSALVDDSSKPHTLRGSLEFTFSTATPSILAK